MSKGSGVKKTKRNVVKPTIHGMTTSVVRKLARTAGKADAYGIIKNKFKMMSKHLYEKTVEMIKNNELKNYFKIKRLYYLGDLSPYINFTLDKLKKEASVKYYAKLQNNGQNMI